MLETLIPILLFPIPVTMASQCELNGPQGYWVETSICAGNAWDGIFIATTEIGDHQYKVDWCGWKNNREHECSINCLGSCNSYGTVFPSSEMPGFKPCQPESVRVKRWICNDCSEDYQTLVSYCGGADDIAFFDNQTCQGACYAKNFGTPEQCGD